MRQDIDQLLHFKQALVDHSDEGSSRTTDGILLTLLMIKLLLYSCIYARILLEGVEVTL